jgi:hypothetical protein
MFGKTLPGPPAARPSSFIKFLPAAPKPSRLNRSGLVRTKIEPSVTRGWLAQQMRVARMARLDILVEPPCVLYLKLHRRPAQRRQAYNSMELSPAADRLAGDLLIKAFLDESAERSAVPRRDEIRHRAAGAA